MSCLARIQRALARTWRAEGGAVTVEFVIIFPFVLSLLLMSIDSGITQLRQVFLHRAVDLAVREVRLGRTNDADRMSDLICARTAMLPGCRQKIAVEMQPINTETFDGLDAPNQCVDRETEIAPALVFDPGAGEQELMLIRVCVIADPFVRLTGYISALPMNEDGDYVLVSNSVFVMEPR